MSETAVPETAFIPTTTILRLCHLEALVPFISNEETRYYLNGVSVKRHPTEGLAFCATDGHVLGLVHDPDAVHTGEDQFILRVSDLIPAAKLVWKGWSKNKSAATWERYIVIDRSKSTVATVRFVIGSSPQEILKGEGKDYSLPIDNPIIDGTFPDYTKVFPTFGPKAACSGAPIQAAFFETVYKGAKAFAGKKSIPISFAAPVDDGPARVYTGKTPQPDPTGKRDTSGPRMFTVQAQDEHDSRARMVGILMGMRGDAGPSVEASPWLCQLLGRDDPNAVAPAAEEDAAIAA
ncbi:beta clamp domain-containing protein [Acidiphilium angustum]|uniref:hypothetical protein n=1 Tax=Acidiphilium angustum TaxID=523 RepID=UPI00138DF88E|nr:hypothetical protein [Acidiphilium angustum]